MSELKHHAGLQGEINKQASDNIKKGGPTDAFKMEAARHGVNLKPTNTRVTRKDGICFMGDKGLVLCKKCGKKTQGYWREQICEECYEN